MKNKLNRNCIKYFSFESSELTTYIVSLEFPNSEKLGDNSKLFEEY